MSKIKHSSSFLHQAFFWTLCSFLTISVFAGCQPSGESESDEDEVTAVEETPDPITLLVVGDENVGNVIKRQWAARRDGEINLITKTEREFEESRFDFESADVLLFPPALLGEFDSKELLQEIPRRIWNSEEINRQEFLRLHRMMYVRHGDRTLAVPMGSPHLAVIYNTKVVQAIGKPLPDSWPEFIEYVQAMRGMDQIVDEDGNKLPNQFEVPTSRRWPTQIYLAQTGSMIRSRGRLSTVFDRKTMEPLIESLPFERGLENLQALIGDDWQTRRTPEEIYQRVMMGETAMAITWPSMSFLDEDLDSSKIVDVEISRLPGFNQWYDTGNQTWNLRDRELSDHVAFTGFTGLIASVSQASRNTNTSFDFLQWLVSKQVNLITVTDSPVSGPFRASHLGDPSRWTGDLLPEKAADQYADVIYEINDQSIIFMFPRIPGHNRYLDAMNIEIWKYIEGEQEGKAALQAAAKKWNEITDELGRSDQRGELRKDAGL